MGREYGVLGLRQINTCRKVPLQVNFLDDDILHCFLWVSSFYDPPPTHHLLYANLSNSDLSTVSVLHSDSSTVVIRLNWEGRGPNLYLINIFHSRIKYGTPPCDALSHLCVWQFWFVLKMPVHLIQFHCLSFLSKFRSVQGCAKSRQSAKLCLQSSELGLPHWYINRIDDVV